MGLFGKKYVPGITQYELKHDHIQSRLDSVFPAHHASSHTKRAALHAALGIAGDRDVNMGTRQKGGIIQRDEFHSVVSSLESGGIINAHEAEKLRAIAEKPLRD